MDKVCTDCGAKHWEAELPSQCTSQNKFWMSCCKAGAVKLEPLQSPPTFLRILFEEMSTRGRHFRDNIRRYNAAFGFTSLRCEISNSNLGNIPFQIHDQMYLMQGSLLSEEDANARYAQLYIFDPQYASFSQINKQQ